MAASVDLRKKYPLLSKILRSKLMVNLLPRLFSTLLCKFISLFVAGVVGISLTDKERISAEALPLLDRSFSL